MSRNVKPLFFLSAGLCAVLVFVLSFFPLYSNDAFFHIAYGKYILANLSIPLEDPFNFTYPGKKANVVPFEWGAHILIALIFLQFGFTGVIALKAAIYSLALSIPLTLSLKLNSWRSPVFIWILICLVPIHIRFLLRSTMFTELFTVVTLTLLLLAREVDKKYLRALPLVFMIWANFHPGYPVGLFFLYSYLAADLLFECFGQKNFQPFKEKGLIALGSLISVTLQPEGIRGLSFPVEKILDPNYQIFRKYIFEWTPLWDPQLFGSSFSWVYLGLFMLALSLCFFYPHKKAQHRLVDLLWLVILFVFGTSAVRNSSMANWVFFVLGSLYITGIDTQKMTNRFIWLKQRPWLGLALVSFLLVATIAKISTSGYKLLTSYREPAKVFTKPLNEKRYPIEAVKIIDSLPAEKVRMFNSMGFGAFLVWYYNGTPPVYYHGFFDDPVVFEELYYTRLESVEKIRALVDEFGINMFLLRNLNRPKTELPLHYVALINSKKWQLVSLTPAALLFVKKGVFTDISF